MCLQLGPSVSDPTKTDAPVVLQFLNRVWLPAHPASASPWGRAHSATRGLLLRALTWF